jgi:signal peptidase II
VPTAWRPAPRRGLPSGGAQPKSGAMLGNSPTTVLWGPFSRLCAYIAVVTFAVDQSHKLWMLAIYRIKERGRVQILPFLDVVYVLNKGVSYGFLAGDGQLLLIGFALLTALALWIWVAMSARHWLLSASLGLIIGGAIGNALDRVLHGGVVDYVSLHAFGYYWYVFNIADAAIVAGVIGLLYKSWWSSRSDATNAA